MSAIDVVDVQMTRLLVSLGVPQDYAAQLVVLLGMLRAGASEAVSDVVPTVTGRPATSFATYAADHAAAWR